MYISNFHIIYIEVTYVCGKTEAYYRSLLIDNYLPGCLQVLNDNVCSYNWSIIDGFSYTGSKGAHIWCPFPMKILTLFGVQKSTPASIPDV